MVHPLNYQSNYSRYNILCIYYLLFIIIITITSQAVAFDSSNDNHDITIIDHHNRLLLNNIPFIAIFTQIGQFMHWSSLLNCIDNIVTARSLNTDITYFNLTKYDIIQNKVVSNFNLDIYISFSHNIDMKHRNIIINELNRYKEHDNSSYHNAINEIIITSVKNVGLDVKPFLEQISKAQQSHHNYDYILKLHSKSNKQWLTHSLQCLCGTSMQVLSILNHFSSNDKVIHSHSHNDDDDGDHDGVDNDIVVVMMMMMMIHMPMCYLSTYPSVTIFLIFSSIYLLSIHLSIHLSFRIDSYDRSSWCYLWSQHA